jgi:hypothetical protein
MRKLMVMAVACAALTALPGRAGAQGGCTDDDVFQAAEQAGRVNARDQLSGGACGAFFGPGSRAMAVRLVAQQCDPNFIWTVLRFEDGTWRHVDGPWDHTGRIIGISAVGDDIREEQPIFRRADNGCKPTGGSRARLWHWDGTRLAPGPFTRARAADPKPVSFKIFDHDVDASCVIHDDHHLRRVSCAYRGTPRFGVRLASSGKVTRCHCLHDAGVNDFVRTLASGHHITVGRFRCALKGPMLTCRVTATGKGFSLTDTGRVRRVG